MTRSTHSRTHAGPPAMTRTFRLFAISLIALSLALPASALGASTSRRSALTNVTLSSYDCALGANKARIRAQ